VVGAPDFSILMAAMGQSDSAVDLTGDAITGAPDFALFFTFHGEPPGPSGLDCSRTANPTPVCEGPFN
jgi:hypothetical protein